MKLDATRSDARDGLQTEPQTTPSKAAPQRQAGMHPLSVSAGRLGPSEELRSPVWPVATGAVLWLVSFVTYYSIAISFERLGVFVQPNLVFHADPMWRVQSFSTGNGWSDRNVLHPNLANYFAIPNTLVCKLLAAAGLYSGDQEALSRQLALQIAPFFAASTVAVVFAMVVRAEFSIMAALLMAVLAAGSFSHLVFGSIPDHFAIGGFCIAAGGLLAVELVRAEGRIRWAPWIVLGIFTLGVTSTNIVWVGLLFTAPQLWALRQWRTPLKRVALWAALVVVGTIAIAEIGNRAYQYPKATAWIKLESKAYTEAYRNEGLLHLLNAPAVLADSFSPSRVDTMANEAARDMRIGRPYRFTVEKSHAWSPVLLVSAALLIGALGWLFDAGPYRIIAISFACILAGNLTLHGLVGEEYVVFAEHWLVAALFLIAGSFRLAAQWRKPVAAALFVMAGLMVLNNAVLLRGMLTTLAIEGTHH